MRAAPAGHCGRVGNFRFFSDEEKHAIALESDEPGVSVSQFARRHGIVTGMLFRWRVQFGMAQKKCAKLAPPPRRLGTIQRHVCWVISCSRRAE